MFRKSILLVLAIIFLLMSSAQAANIIFVTGTRDIDADGIQDDTGWIEWLEATGHTIDVQIDYWATLDAGKIDALNAADLIILSRGTSSGNYNNGDEVAQWNSITTPIIMMNVYIARSSRWLWMDTDTIPNLIAPAMVVVEPDHPIFTSVELGASNQIQISDGTVGTGQTSFIGPADVGNGTLIARTAGSDSVWIAEWEPGVEFYNGSGQFAGERRLIFAGGTQEAGATPQGAFNFNAVGEKMLLNAILYMLGEDLNPSVAINPKPADTAKDISRDTLLSWTPGENIATHDVYFGIVFADVNDADRTNPLNVLLSQGQDANTYEPQGHLEFSQTYYWRIDEIETNGATIHKGSVWSFIVEPVAYPIPGENIIATASSSEEAKGPENTVDGSGIDESGLLHNNISMENMWLSGRDEQSPAWIAYEFDKVYKLYQMWVWNSNDGLESVVGLGFKDVTIEYSLDGVDYITLGTTHEFAQAPGANNYEHNTTIEFNGLPAKYVRLTANSNWGGLLNQYGLSEVRFLHIPVHAQEPVPGSGATNVSLEVSLGWRAGREAAEHNVFFSDDEQTIIDGTADVTTVTNTSYGPLSLDLGKTYYWQVEEVNGAEVWRGDIWSFTAQEYFVVDDFEDYNDYEPDRIFDSWIDGWNIATNGSTIGYPDPDFPAGEHFVETTIVNSGSQQSMPYFYDNSVGNSEATLTLSSRRNWTEKGTGSLTLWYRGNPAGFVEDPPGTYTINASGVDIWGTADEFRYVYKQLSGDGSIIARVESVEDTDDWAKAGVMIRQTLDPDSKFAAVYITPANGCRFQARLTPAADATSDTSVATPEETAITAPYWVKVERTGNNFNGYYSSDGVNWVAMAWNPQNTAMPADVYIGLAVTSHSSGVNCTAVISNVETTGTVSPQTWTQQVIGAAEMPSNDAAQMYVVLNGSAVEYNDNPDASLVDEWTEWNIDLQKFVDQGVDLTDVDKIGIGFGDRDNPQPGGLGFMFFDDIRLYPSRPPELEPEPEPEPESEL